MQPGFFVPLDIADGGDAREARAPSSGLSKSHISPRAPEPCVTVCPGASYLKVYRGPQRPEPQREREAPPKRGRCLHFSAPCQRRLRNAMAQMLRIAPAAFATLTYPAVWEPNARTWKRHLDMLTKRMRRRYPELAGFWKLEFQRRGAPHFHLMIFGAPTTEDNPRAFVELRQWIATNWFEVVASGDEKHLYAGTQLDEVRTNAQQYTCKYVSKDQLPESVRDTHNGRWWGAFNRSKLPKVEPVEIPLLKHEAQFLLRIVKRHVSRLQPPTARRPRYRRRRSRASTGIVLICDATVWARRLEDICALARANHVPPENRPF